MKPVEIELGQSKAKKILLDELLESTDKWTNKLNA